MIEHIGRTEPGLKEEIKRKLGKLQNKGDEKDKTAN